MLTKLRAAAASQLIQQSEILQAELIEEILARLEPMFWESGYMKNAMSADDNSKVRIFAVPLDNEEWTTWDRNDFEFSGFTDEGVITDSYCAIVVTAYELLSLKDLVFVHDVLFGRLSNLK